MRANRQSQWCAARAILGANVCTLPRGESVITYFAKHEKTVPSIGTIMREGGGEFREKKVERYQVEKQRRDNY